VKQRLTWTACIALVAVSALMLAGCPAQKAESPSGPAMTGTTPPPEPSAETTAAEPPENIGNAKNAEGKYVCPVTGDPVTDFSPENAAEYEGKAYFFCCPGCKPKFEKDPAKYAAEPAAGEAAPSEETGAAEATESPEAAPEPEAEGHDSHEGRDHG